MRFLQLSKIHYVVIGNYTKTATYSHLHILEDLLLCLSAKWRDQSHIFWRENLKSVFSKEQDVILAQRKEMNENTKETQQRGYRELNVTLINCFIQYSELIYKVYWTFNF